MIEKSRIADPKAHYGHGKHATRTFFVQRVTGALNVVFLGFFVWFVVSLAGQDRAAMVGTIANPFVAIVLVLLMVNVAIHMRIGVGEVIEDYLDEQRTNRLGRTANDIYAILIAVASIGAIVKIVFWG